MSLALEIASQYIETKIITSKDLQTPEYGVMSHAKLLLSFDQTDLPFESAGEYYLLVKSAYSSVCSMKLR
jgi:hypothetical protein